MLTNPNGGGDKLKALLGDVCLKTRLASELFLDEGLIIG